MGDQRNAKSLCKVCVGENDNLAVGAKKPKMTKLTYAEVAKVSKAVEVQNAVIAGNAELKEGCTTPPH